ncbi:MAG: hypothetical protein GTO41_29010, partial [Burkholderiales bacterium]|nr:hypothetical protein [Burkholderiales bacterium]
MRRFLEVSTFAALVMVFAVVSGCGDGGNEQQAVSSGASPAAPVGQTLTLKVASAFPTSLDLIGEAAVTYADKVRRVSGGT